MPAAWPATLPQRFVLDSYSEESDGEGLLRSNPAQGPAKIRPRVSAVARLVGGIMVMTSTQWTDLLTFRRVTLVRGSLPFTFPVPGGAGTWLVRFTEPPVRTGLNGVEWDVAIRLEVLP